MWVWGRFDQNLGEKIKLMDVSSRCKEPEVESRKLFVSKGKVRFPEGKVFGSIFVKMMDVSIVSVIVVEGYAQGDPAQNKASHQDPPQRLQHISFPGILKRLLFSREVLWIFSDVYVEQVE